nr:unnamed protein product [Digitaria exilis]
MLPRGLGVVEPTGDEDIKHIRPHRARRSTNIVQRGVSPEPKELRHDGEQQRPLRAEAEPDDHRRHVERPPRCAGGDEEVTGAGDDEHRRDHGWPWDLGLREVSGGHPAGVVPDADEGDEGVDGLCWIT